MKASFPAHFRQLPQILLWLRGHLLQLQCPAPLTRKLELAIEEVVVNIFRYSRSELLEISLIGEAKQHVEITIADRGLPFNPIEQAPPVDRSSPLEHRKEGGLGIFLVKHIADEISYAREGDRNILTLKKRFH